MSPEANKALVRRLIDEVWNGGNLDAANELIAPDYVRNAPNATPGLDAFKQFVMAIRSAFTEGGLVVEDIFAGGRQSDGTLEAARRPHGRFFRYPCDRQTYPAYWNRYLPSC
jgi:hypothetical protein